MPPSSLLLVAPGIFDNPTVPDPVADPQVLPMGNCGRRSQTCVAYDSISLKRIVPVLDGPSPPTVICRGDTVPLVAVLKMGGCWGLHWAPANLPQ